MLMRQEAVKGRLAAAMLAVAAWLGLGIAGWPQAAAQEPPEPPKAEQPDKKDAEDAPKAAPFQVTVVSVSGVARKRQTSVPNSKWQPLKPGEILGEQTLIRTGLGTKVVLQLADRGLVVVGSNTKTGIGTFRKRGKVLKARLGLKYGSLRVRVDGTRGPNDLQVSTPVAILSVRGCGADIRLDDHGLSFRVFEHQWVIRTGDGREKKVREKESTDHKLTPWRKLLTRGRHVDVGDPGKGVSKEDRDSMVENADGRAILDFAGGDRGRWLLASPTCDQGEGEYKADTPPIPDVDPKPGEYKPGDYKQPGAGIPIPKPTDNDVPAARPNQPNGDALPGSQRR